MSRFKVACLVFLGFMVLMGSEAIAESGCVPVSIQSEAASTDPVNVFALYKGTMAAIMEGLPAVAGATTIAPREIKMGDDGSIHMISTLTVFLPDGSTLKQNDDAVLDPTETPLVYRVNSRLNIVEGTGVFTNTVGKFNGHGVFNLATGHIEVIADGKLCW
ncbi:MAG TPA: hypothetical protein VIX18_03290 [Nitrospirota bacterium]